MLLSIPTADSWNVGRLLSQDEIDNVFRNLKDQDEDAADRKAEIIKAIAISSKTIVSGKDTPTRVEKPKD